MPFVRALSQNAPKSDKVYIAPSGVQKERIQPAHIFVLPYPSPPSPYGDRRVFLRRPSLDLRESACTPLFWNAFDLRGAGSCIHTHSQNAVMVTLWTPGNIFRISHQVRKQNVLSGREIILCVTGGKNYCLLLPCDANRENDYR